MNIRKENLFVGMLGRIYLSVCIQERSGLELASAFCNDSKTAVYHRHQALPPLHESQRAGRFGPGRGV